MKKSGFTLVELLAVITILSLVALVTSISVANMLKTSKEDLSVAQIKSIELAAKSWGADNIDLLPTGNNCSYLTLKDLKDDGLLDSNIVDPKNKTQISNNMIIKVLSKLNSKGKSVLTYEVDSNNIEGCSYIGNTILVDVPQGLTPVIYDGTNWKVPELNEEWYNYDKQMWANAVVLGKGKTKKPGEVVTVEGNNADALMMLVYMPRFEYKIDGEYGKGGISAELPGEIEVNFIGKNTITPTEGYHIHPAFEFDGEKSGFWVGKFELSSVGTGLTSDNNLACSTTSCTNAQYLRILPNVSSLRYNNVSNFWYGIKSIENTSSFGLSNMDIHMMKNSEWGAVAYLSQSKYGKYGNSDYENKYREVYQNKDAGYITGKSNGTVSKQETRSEGQCAYNDKTNLGSDSNGYKKGQCGPGASTTGNVYGIYDISGGSQEYVMGAYEAETNGVAGIELKYYDKDKINIGATACEENKPCYGYALSITSGWYDDYHTNSNENYTWLVRGGSYESNAGAGAFSFGYNDGTAIEDFSTRVVGFRK